MRKILTLHLASNFVLPFVVATVFFVSFLLTFELFKIANLIATQTVEFSFVMKLIWNMAITLIPMAIPLSIFFSLIFSLGKLSSDSEYIAMRSLGMTKFQILKPFLFIGISIGIANFFLVQEFVPLAHKDMRQKIIILSSESLVAGLKSGQFFTSLPNVTLFATHISDDSKHLKEVFISLKDGKSEKAIFSKSGELLYDKNSKTGIESLNLHLKDGNIVEMNKGKEEETKVLFEDYIFPITSKKFSYHFLTRETMMKYKELSKFLEDGFSKAEKKGYDERDFFNAKFEYWNRMLTPFVCLLFTFMGFVLGIKKTRGTNKNASAIAVLYLISYYVIYFSSISLARDQNVPMPLALSLSLIFLFIASMRLYKKLDWQS